MDAKSGWTYSETIDEDRSAIRVRGRVDRLGVDLLRGTIEELSRRGHRDITVTVEHPNKVDPCARAVLAEVAARLEGCQGRLTIRWSGKDDTHADRLGEPDHGKVDCRGPRPDGEISESRLAPG
jgi:hypothetical protein